MELNNNPQFMTLKEVAEHLRVTEKTIHRLLDKNAIPATRVGHLWRFERESLNKWLQERTTGVKNRILVIDDEESVRILIKKSLEKLGQEVVITGSGHEGLKLIQEGDFNLVFLDLKMPEMDGAEVFGRIRQEKPNMPVVIITGYPDSKLMMKAMSFGPFSIMNKPFSNTDIVQVVNSYIRISK
jgi:excisionase family DNA binding protein